MKNLFILVLCLIFSLGCARVRVEAPKEPIKVDISMRLDIYQHVQKDIDAIENIVSGDKGKTKSGNNQSFLDYLGACAYAQEELGPEVEAAALRRKDRRQQLSSLEEKGLIGENKSGLLEMRNSGAALLPSVKQLVKDENNDRMIIYQAVARKNNISVEEVKKMYAKRLQEDAPFGAPVEGLNEATGSYEWKVKQ